MRPPPLHNCRILERHTAKDSIDLTLFLLIGYAMLSTSVTTWWPATDVHRVEEISLFFSLAFLGLPPLLALLYSAHILIGATIRGLLAFGWEGVPAYILLDIFTSPVPWNRRAAVHAIPVKRNRWNFTDFRHSQVATSDASAAEIVTWIRNSVLREGGTTEGKICTGPNPLFDGWKYTGVDPRNLQ